MHPRNFGQKSSVRTQRPHPHISGCEMPYLLATVGVQSMFNLIADIQLMVKWQLSKKGIRWSVSHDCIARLNVQLIEVTSF